MSPDAPITYGLLLAAFSMVIATWRLARWFNSVITGLKTSIEIDLKRLGDDVNQSISAERAEAVARMDKLHARVSALHEDHRRLELEVAKTYATKSGVKDGFERMEKLIGEGFKQMSSLLTSRT